LRQLKNKKAITIKPTDKNLGPVVMDTSEYVNRVLTEHLLTKDYKQLTQSEATNKIEQLKDTLKKLISSHSHILSQAELTYFKWSLMTCFRLPIFYGLPKVHKTLFSLWPVVSMTNSLLAVFSIWLDYKMKELLPFIMTNSLLALFSIWLDYKMKELLPFIKFYIKNSMEVINDLKNLHIPQNAPLFSADAISMYTSIEITSGLQSIRNFLACNQDDIPDTFPRNLFLEILETVMNSNIFSFPNTFWHQLAVRYSHGHPCSLCLCNHHFWTL
jgi:predicted DNA-binding protein (UPF0251 family)